MNKIDTEYGSIADVPQSVVQYYEEETRSRVIGYEPSEDENEPSTPITEEYMAVVLNKPDEVLYSQVSQRIGERKSRDVVDAELARAIEWEEFYYGHDLTLRYEKMHPRWVTEEPQEYGYEDDVEYELAHREWWIELEPQLPVVDLEVRRALYQVTIEDYDSNVEVLVQYDRTYDDFNHTTLDTPSTEPRDPVLIIADNEVSAKVTRDTALSANIEVLGVVWQVRVADRDNINEAINKGVRNQLSGSETRWWILADNTIRETTLNELGQVMDAYTLRMDDIYLQYGTWRAGDKLTPFVY